MSICVQVRALLSVWRQNQAPAHFDPLFHKLFDTVMTSNLRTLRLRRGIYSLFKSHKWITASAAKRSGSLQMPFQNYPPSTQATSRGTRAVLTGS
jgi:hypothetical protein